MDYDQNVREKIRKEYEEFNQPLKVALVGQPGAGKSSLINRLVNEDIMPVGAETDKTKEAKGIEYKRLIITDLPGYGTKGFPIDQWVSTFNVADYDLYIFVFSGKLHDSDSVLFRMMEKWRKERQHPYFIVRNYADAIYDDKKTDEELREIIRNDVREKSGLSAAKVYFTSCRKNCLEGIEELRTDIENTDGDNVRKGKFIASFRAKSLKDLDLKREECLKTIDMFAMAAAANGLNPVPGVDAAVDLSIVHKMFQSIRSTFDLKETKTDIYTQFAGPLGKEVMEYVGKEQIVKYLEKYAGKYIGKTFSKYIPFLGQVISMTMSYLMVEGAGKYYVGICYDLAKVILEKNLKFDA